MTGRLGFWIKFWYGLGQTAEGMKNAAFGAFLLLFYSQVLGFPLPEAEGIPTLEVENLP